VNDLQWLLTLLYVLDGSMTYGEVCFDKVRSVRVKSESSSSKTTILLGIVASLWSGSARISNMLTHICPKCCKVVGLRGGKPTSIGHIVGTRLEQEIYRKLHVLAIWLHHPS